MRSWNRGQTTIDFAVGASVFLLAVIFVVLYAPTLFDPFAGGTGTKFLVADRGATMLAGDVLAVSTAEPGSLSVGCVAVFFEGSEIEGANCETNIDNESLDSLLSLDGRSASVTIHHLDEPASEPAEPTWDGELLVRSTDDSVPSDVAVATRTVAFDGQQYRLTVRVW